MDNDNMSVFISHNKNDKEVAREIGLFIVSEDVNVWFDEWNISIGESITERINEGLRNCSHFIFLWSINAQNSVWVLRELNSIMNLSIANNGLPKIIPIVLDETPLPPLANDLLYIRYNSGDESDRINIIKSITGETPTQNYIKAIVKKYNEVIFDYDQGSPLPFKACPNCGSQRLDCKSFTDYERDELYFIAKCKECDWSEWTQ